MKYLVASLFFSLFGFYAFSQDGASIVVKGKVKDEKGNPVVGASVVIKGTNSGISTDTLGGFSVTANPGAIMVISGMGFQTTSITLNNRESLEVVLKTEAKSLKEVEVVSKTNEPTIPMSQEQVDNVVVQNMLDQFINSQNMNVGGLQLSNNTVINMGQVAGAPIGQSITTWSTSPSGTLYTGAAIPVFQHKEETKGSRYFFDNWVHGSVVDTANHIIDNKNYVFNYDKIAGNLLLRQNANTVVEIEKNELKAFVMKDKNERVYFFEKTIFDKKRFSQALVKDYKRYSLYKSTRTKFKKSDYRSDGLTESGNPYDEYVDESVYIVVMPGSKEFAPVVFKKKALKDLFPNDSAKVNKYFADHDEDNVDEAFVVGLVNYLNK